jgi:hypothetical protein
MRLDHREYNIHGGLVAARSRRARRLHRAPAMAHGLRATRVTRALDEALTMAAPWASTMPAGLSRRRSGQRSTPTNPCKPGESWS